jgi:hypothetical protein
LSRQLLASDAIGASLGGAQVVCVFITLLRSIGKHDGPHLRRAPRAGRSAALFGQAVPTFNTDVVWPLALIAVGILLLAGAFRR